MRQWLRENGTWQNVARVAGLAIVAVQLRQQTIGAEVNQPMLFLAAGLFGLTQIFKRNGSEGK
jgi:hypothetical protein